MATTRVCGCPPSLTSRRPGGTALSSERLERLIRSLGVGGCRPSVGAGGASRPTRVRWPKTEAEEFRQESKFVRVDRLLSEHIDSVSRFWSGTMLHMRSEE